jgi:hypothetical protein
VGDGHRGLLSLRRGNPRPVQPEEGIQEASRGPPPHYAVEQRYVEVGLDVIGQAFEDGGEVVAAGRSDFGTPTRRRRDCAGGGAAW